MRSDHSNVFRRFLYPDMEEAVLSSAVMGNGVICLHHGLFYLVWWEEDEQCSRPLMWEECRECGNINRFMDACETCILLEDKVA